MQLRAANARRATLDRFGGRPQEAYTAVGHFDFVGQLSDLPQYSDTERSVRRLNQRHPMVVGAFADEIEGARVLDLAALDGRWCHAFAAAGAREVVGPESKTELIGHYERFPPPPGVCRVDLRRSELFEALVAATRIAARFDVVTVLGLLDQLADHHRLFSLISQLHPSLVIVDSSFGFGDRAIVDLSVEPLDDSMASALEYPDREVRLVGRPSVAGLELLAESVGFGCEWVDPESLAGDERNGVADYFGTEDGDRRVCGLRPIW